LAEAEQLVSSRNHVRIELSPSGACQFTAGGGGQNGFARTRIGDHVDEGGSDADDT